MIRWWGLEVWIIWQANWWKIMTWLAHRHCDTQEVGVRKWGCRSGCTCCNEALSSNGIKRSKDKCIYIYEDNILSNLQRKNLRSGLHSILTNGQNWWTSKPAWRISNTMIKLVIMMMIIVDCSDKSFCFTVKLTINKSLERQTRQDKSIIHKISSQAACIWVNHNEKGIFLLAVFLFPPLIQPWTWAKLYPKSFMIGVKMWVKEQDNVFEIKIGPTFQGLTMV